MKDEGKGKGPWKLNNVPENEFEERKYSKKWLQNCMGNTGKAIANSNSEDKSKKDLGNQKKVRKSSGRD